MRETMEEPGSDPKVADKFEVLFDDPEVNFVFLLLNKAGIFPEILGPWLCERLGLPHPGANPILGSLLDNKQLA